MGFAGITILKNKTKLCSQNYISLVGNASLKNKKNFVPKIPSVQDVQQETNLFPKSHQSNIFNNLFPKPHQFSMYSKIQICSQNPISQPSLRICSQNPISQTSLTICSQDPISLGCIARYKFVPKAPSVNYLSLTICSQDFISLGCIARIHICSQNPICLRLYPLLRGASPPTNFVPKIPSVIHL